MLPYMVFSTAMDFMQHIAWAQSTVPMMHIHNKFLIHLFLFMYDCNCNTSSQYLCMQSSFVFVYICFKVFLAFIVLSIQNVSWITSQVLQMYTTNKDIWRNWLALCIPFSRCEYVTVEISPIICAFVWTAWPFQGGGYFFFCFSVLFWQVFMVKKGGWWYWLEMGCAHICIFV